MPQIKVKSLFKSSSKKSKSTSKSKDKDASRRSGSPDTDPSSMFDEPAGRPFSSVPMAPTRKLNGDDKALMATSKWSEISDLKLEDAVSIVDAKSVSLQGIVAYVGYVHFSEGIWVGVQLTGPSIGKGYNDGSYRSKRYFQNVGRKNGVFVPLKQVQKRVKTNSGDKAHDRSNHMRKTSKAQMAEVKYVDTLKKEREVAILKKSETKQRTRWSKFDDEEIYIQRLKQKRLDELRLSRAEPMANISGPIKGPKLRFGGANSKMCKADLYFVHGLHEAQQNYVLTDPTLPDNPVIFASQAFLNMSGYDSTEILGKNCRFLQGDDTDDRAVEKIREAILEGSDCSICLLNYRKNGTPFWNQFFITSLRDKRGRVKNYVGVQCEVSQEYARKVNRADKRFARKMYVPEVSTELSDESSLGTSNADESTKGDLDFLGPQMLKQSQSNETIGPSNNNMSSPEAAGYSGGGGGAAPQNMVGLMQMQQQLIQMQQMMQQMQVSNGMGGGGMNHPNMNQMNASMGQQMHQHQNPYGLGASSVHSRNDLSAASNHSRQSYQQPPNLYQQTSQNSFGPSTFNNGFQDTARYNASLPNMGFQGGVDHSVSDDGFPVIQPQPQSAFHESINLAPPPPPRITPSGFLVNNSDSRSHVSYITEPEDLGESSPPVDPRAYSPSQMPPVFEMPKYGDSPGRSLTEFEVGAGTIIKKKKKKSKRNKE